MKARWRVVAPALLGLAVATACDAPRAAPCPGERVGTFRFRGEVVPDGGCPFPAPAVDFTATLAFGSDSSALLCVDRPEAEPLRGTHEGDRVTVSTSDAGANVPSCACDVELSETVEGDVVRDGGSAAGFSGELRNEMRPADAGASCERDAGTACGVPCELRWRLTGS